jgi:hypothetical protein
LEIFDFTVNALRELETELDRLSCALAEITELQRSKIKDLSEKLTRTEEKMVGLERETEKLKKIILASSTQKIVHQQDKNGVFLPESGYAPSIRLNCKQWEDFQALAGQAQTVTFECAENDKKLRATALKNSQIFVYEGELPDLRILLKPWLSNQLEKDQILEGWFQQSG